LGLKFQNSFLLNIKILKNNKKIDYNFFIINIYSKIQHLKFIYHTIFDTEFILNLIFKYKLKKALSNNELVQLIEKKRIILSRISILLLSFIKSV